VIAVPLLKIMALAVGACDGAIGTAMTRTGSSS
jgi:hypothetical protein